VLLILGAFTLSWLLPRDPAPASAQSNGDQSANKPSQISVVGTGSIAVTPDVVKITIGVSEQEATVKDTQDKVDSTMAAITAKLKEAGITEKDYHTAQYSVEPVMDFNNPTKGQPNGTLSGFRVVNMLEVTVHDASQAASLIDSLVSAGANTIYGINFSVSNPEALQQQAYDQAMQDAKSRAEKLAALSNQSLGKIISVSESAAGVPMPMYDKSVGLGGGGIAPGQQTVQTALVVVGVASPALAQETMKPGPGQQKVTVESGNQVSPDQKRTVTLTVKEVNPADNRVTFEAHVKPEAGGVVAMNQLKEGSKVRATFDPKTGDILQLEILRNSDTGSTDTGSKSK